MIRPTPVGAMLSSLLCGCLCACGGAGGGPAPAVTAAVKHPGGGADDMVQAVSSGRDAPALELKFALGQRPVTGQPLDIRLRWIPHMELGHLETRLHADDGLELRSGTGLPVLEHPARDVPVEQHFAVMPAHDGIFAIQVTVTMDSDSGVVSRTFAIPVIVAQAGTDDAGPKP